jgi:hypothetical protein
MEELVGEVIGRGLDGYAERSDESLAPGGSAGGRDRSSQKALLDRMTRFWGGGQVRCRRPLIYSGLLPKAPAI